MIVNKLRSRFILICINVGSLQYKEELIFLLEDNMKQIRMNLLHNMTVMIVNKLLKICLEHHLHVLQLFGVLFEPFLLLFYHKHHLLLSTKLFEHLVTNYFLDFLAKLSTLSLIFSILHFINEPLFIKIVFFFSTFVNLEFFVLASHL